MSVVDPRVIIRLGSHAEKEYLQKTGHLFNGLIIGANLIEATPGATASLVIKLCGAKQALPYYVDPMTYAFGCYIDPNSGKPRSDLDWIKSDQKVKGKTIRDFKRSYASLVGQLGNPFNFVRERNSALSAEDFAGNGVLRSACQTVVNYQLNRISGEIAKDPEYQQYVKDIPRPNAVFAPYFYIEPTNEKAWTDLTLQLATETANLGLDLPVHAIICADESFLKNAAFLDRIKNNLPRTGVKGVWFWFSKFHEDRSDENNLKSFRSLVEDLSKVIEVYNLHGGYFSLALSKFGLAGVSHGVGYGEQKDVVPVIGQSTPTVRYYLPALHRRLGVPQIERCFDSLGVKTSEEFYEHICDCVVCKGVIADNVRSFSAFGDMHHSTPMSKRRAQTPAAAKRCRYHFLLNRVKEREWITKATTEEITKHLVGAFGKWSTQPSVTADCTHLETWKRVLS
ncbi:MAG: hypothetical protein EPN55_03275 [Gammaproteobacteria bacterium]|nr:MAG: hypothetical protein EPN55_03275 [Gammaproteobacteria bacterium]